MFRVRINCYNNYDNKYYFYIYVYIIIMLYVYFLQNGELKFVDFGLVWVFGIFV